MTSEPEVFTAWITKYALDDGIYMRTVVRDDDPQHVHVNGQRHHSYIGEGIEWHRTEASALARAEEMRQAAIKRHRAQIEKLEKIEFKV
jgi:hypothetical protein